MLILINWIVVEIALYWSRVPGNKSKLIAFRATGSTCLITTDLVAKKLQFVNVRIPIVRLSLPVLLSVYL